ncbi:type I polyketide synthase [Streptomyces hoynatensis]|uniref:SDR family NAD(P)-dependent oxidoreductase n=1 Tax=Streptomyces hoynatensis TaxID=1141874 RepID=A0A3A9ZFA0_9ACTN|nr:type I polyketide synthase [Streptomyces hoynatensis]RKN47020.1 SDR family NAD(P)-dependent oxidoreductase [Streptomyces hoynatensis]
MSPDPAQQLAVVGMAGRFPGAADTERFWQLLVDRGDPIRPVPKDRWDATAFLDPELPIQAVGGFLDDVREFDATFFGISPREAADVDPQHRLMLETCWTALEDAGVPAATLAGTRTGVWVGAAWHDYETLRKERGARATQHSTFGNALDMTAARVSYFLKLKGPSMTVETGCSSSLVALHQAARALIGGEVDAALVGGVNLILAPDLSIGLQHFGGLSATGTCRPFSAAADGFVRSEGVAAVFVKTLERALRDGDRIHGVIARTAVNNDGGGESLVTPSPEGQEDLLRLVYDQSGIPLDELAYVEAHGTGTGRGDPIEAGAIGRALGQRRGKDSGPLLIGSVKSNIGHLEPAAGMAGLFKVLLSLRHRVIPPSLHAEELNPAIPFEELNVRVVREPVELPGEGRLVMGVNSFGWGGTNGHAVVTSPPPATATAAPGAGSVTGTRTGTGIGSGTGTGSGTGAEAAAGAGAPPVPVPFSAQNQEALRQRARDLGALFAAGGVSLPHAAGTLAWQRDHFAARAALVAAGPAEAAERLARFLDDPEDEQAEVVTGTPAEVGRIAFVFPGQGSQWLEMGRELLAGEPRFAATIRRCAKALAPLVDWDLEAVLAGEAGEAWLSQVEVLQPVLWAVCVGLAEVWRSAGVEPDVVIGHSQGEVSAATVAGILSYEDAALTVVERSRLGGRTLGRGRMLAVDLDLQAATAALAGFEESVSVAVNNGPRSCVFSGDADAVLVLKELLEADGVYCRLLDAAYASHSPQMEELRPEVLSALAGIRPREGSVPLMSTVRTEVVPGTALGPAYWMDNLRQPVLFADAVSRLLDEGVTHLIEISAHPILSTAMEELAARGAEPARVLHTLRRGHGGLRDLALAFARAYTGGLAPFGHLPRHAHAPLPPYPWQRRPYWIDPGRRRHARQGELAFALGPSLAERGAWEGRLDLGRDDALWLGDHRVGEAVVLPGAAMLTIALDTARARTGSLPATLADVEFTSDVTLGEAALPLAVRWREDVQDGGAFSLSSLPEGAADWAVHATVRVPWSSPRAKAPDGFPAFPGPLLDGKPQDAGEFYAARAATGIAYGPLLQGVVALHRDEAGALGHVLLPQRCHAQARPHGLHPVLLDSALQVSLALAPPGVTVVPRAVRRLHLLRDPGEPVTEVWSYATPCGAGAQDRYDVFLFDAERRPLAAVEGLLLQAIDGPDATAEAVERHSYRLLFHEQPRGAEAAAPGPLLICGTADGGHRPKALAEAVLRGGGTATVLELDAADPAERLRSAPEGAQVVFLAPPPGEAADPAEGLLSLARLVRGCLSLPVPPRLCVVTAGAQAVAAEDVPDPAGAAYWGFGRVLRHEHPELRSLLLDLPAADADWPAACAAELLAADEAEEQLALRGGRRYAGRLARGEAGPERPAPPWRRPERAYRLVPHRPGLWEGLEFRPLRRREPAAGEIEIEVTASALNFLDLMKALGTFPDPGHAHLLGIECAGRVVRVGAGVTEHAVGDRVVGLALPSIASHVTLRAGHARPVPAGMSDTEAVSLPVALVTAWYALQATARLAAGETVLIHSAAGGLGLAAVQVARRLGAEIIATAGTEEKRRHLRGLGIAHVFDSRDLSWAERVREATGGRGVDVILNSLAGAAIPVGLDALADGGRFVEVGKKDIYGDRAIGLTAFRKGIALASVDVAALMDRRPDHFAEVFAEVWDLVAAGEFTPLPTSCHPVAQAAEAMREMSRGAHIGKFVLLAAPEGDPARQAPPVAPEPLPGGRLREDATYLVTGGLTGLGLSVAEHFAAAGAGALALLGRSAPGEDTARRLAALRAKGVTVETFRADVSDPAALAAALGRLRETMPPLRGVVHSAGVLDDAMIANLGPGALRRVLAPKLHGALHLDAATAGDPLDFFVLFSSAAGLVGTAGQAAYAAGNAAMDALALARRRRGLPALSVQWGPFTDVGLAAVDANRGARLAERGMGALTTAEAWPALDRYLGGEAGEVVSYMRLDVRQWMESYPETAALPSWSELREAAAQGPSRAAGAGQALNRLRSAAAAERPALLQEQVRELAGRVLRLDAAMIEPERPFKEVGLDSLLSLEFRNRLESAFGLKLSPTLLWTYGNVRALAGVLLDRLFEEPSAAQGKD